MANIVTVVNTDDTAVVLCLCLRRFHGMDDGDNNKILFVLIIYYIDSYGFLVRYDSILFYLIQNKWINRYREVII